jgi:hypothetical protein
MVPPVAMEQELATDAQEVHTAKSAPHDGRLAVYAAIGGYAGAIPVPLLPDAVLRRVRGALLHDLAARRGLSLTHDARASLSDPRGSNPTRTLASQALRIVGNGLAIRALRALGPFGFVRPLTGAVQTYVLGRLFDRYLDRHRTSHATTIDVAEASLVRAAIDGALARAVTVHIEADATPLDTDIDRDIVTALVDDVLGRVAGIPEHLTRRLDAAFDHLIANDSP